MAGGARTTTTQPWEAQEPFLTRGFERAENLYNKYGGEGSPYYGGPTVAGFDPAQQVAQRGILGYALGPRPQALQGAAESSLVQGLSGTVDTRAYQPLQNALTQGVMSNLQQKILPGIRESIVNYQPGGGSRGNLVQNQAISNAVLSGLAKPMAEMYTDAYSTAQRQRPQAWSMYPSIMSAPLGLMGAVSDVGADRRAMAQEAINRDIARYTYEQQAPQAALQNYMAGISGDYGSSVTAPGPSPIQSLGQILGIMAPFMGL